MKQTAAVLIPVIFLAACQKTIIAQGTPRITVPTQGISGSKPDVMLTPIFTATAIPSLMPTSLPTAAPLPKCADATLVFRAGVARDATTYGLYTACISGSSLQQLIYDSAISTELSIGRLKVSPDGKKLAVPVFDVDKRAKGHIFVFDLSDYSLSVGFSVAYSVINIAWSSDSKYIAYHMERSDYSQGIEVVHLETKTVSSIVSIEPQDSLIDLVWSPDNRQILYVILDDDYPQNFDYNGYEADVECSTELYQCESSSSSILPWLSRLNYADYSLSMGYQSSLLAISYIDVDMSSGTDHHILELRDLEGILEYQIDLNSLAPDISWTKGSSVLSPDGNRIAFIGHTDEFVPSLYILNIDNATLQNMMDLPSFANMSVFDVGWLP